MPAMTALKQTMTRIVVESYQEMKMVVWPTRKEVIQHTIIVIVFSLVLAAFLGGLDLLFTKGIQKLLEIVQ